jgi:hypothetical protein
VLLILVQVDTEVTGAEEKGRKQQYFAADQHKYRVNTKTLLDFK